MVLVVVVVWREGGGGGFRFIVCGVGIMRHSKEEGTMLFLLKLTPLLDFF